jgi:hypothetical protein
MIIFIYFFEPFELIWVRCVTHNSNKKNNTTHNFPCLLRINVVFKDVVLASVAIVQKNSSSTNNISFLLLPSRFLLKCAWCILKTLVLSSHNSFTKINKKMHISSLFFSNYKKKLLLIYFKKNIYTHTMHSLAGCKEWEK